MTLAQLEHILRAAGAITDENVILVLGSQSVLGAYPELPGDLGLSMEADVFPIQAPEKTDLINGSIGEITHFQTTFGYYAHGLPPDACPLPEGWEKRLHPVQNENTRGVLGLCLDPADLAASKLAAGRPKDITFVAELLTYGLVKQDLLSERIMQLKLQSHIDMASLNLIIASRELPSIGDNCPDVDI